MRQQLAVRIFHRKIFLMVAHHRDQHFFRQRQKLRIEAAENHGRKFRQIHHRVEQRLVFPPARAGNRARRRVERLANLLLALRTAQNLGRAQRIDIGRPGPRNRHVAMRTTSGARAKSSLPRFHQTPAESSRRRASPPASAPDAQSARSACASTYSSASRSRRFPWEDSPRESRPRFGLSW